MMTTSRPDDTSVHAEVMRFHYLEGLSLRAVARRLHLARRTVQRHLAKLPGEAMQVDWADIGFALPGVSRRVRAARKVVQLHRLCIANIMLMRHSCCRAPSVSRPRRRD
jgi:DNA-binding transcriptional regulator LsrR (DeoR family)